MKQSTMYRPEIDGLRAVAVLSVIGFHYFPSLFPGGFIGVDVFFVISGFLISNIIFLDLDAGRFSVSGFYGRRVRRIFPALIVLLTVGFASGWYFLLPENFTEIGKHTLGGATFVSNLILWQESGYFDANAISKPLLHLWSLGVEEQFYLVYPLMLWAAWKLRLPMLGVIATLALLSFASNVSTVTTEKALAFYGPHARFWEMMVGGALALFAASPAVPPAPPAPAKRRSRKKAVSVLIPEAAPDHSRLSLMAAGGLLLVLGAIFGLNEASEFPGWLALLPVAGAAGAIWAGDRAWVNRALLSNPTLVWIGLISFPLYLWHWGLLSFANLILLREPTVAAKLALIAVSILLAWAVYVFVERPVRQRAERAPGAWTLAFLLAVLGAGGALAYGERLPSYRQIREEAALAQASAGEATAGPLPAQAPVVSAPQKQVPAPKAAAVPTAVAASVAPSAPQPTFISAALGASPTAEAKAASPTAKGPMTVAEWTKHFSRITDTLVVPWREDCNFYNVERHRGGKTTYEPNLTNPACIQRDPSKKHVVFLWGDSHAGHLVPGLTKSLPADWQLMIVNTSMCAPAIVPEDAPKHWCIHSNWLAYNAIKEIKPDVVILAQNQGPLPAAIENMGKAIKAAGAQRLILMGPAPRWTSRLPDIVAQKFWETTPRRTLEFNDEPRKSSSRLLQEAFKASTVIDYFNLIDCFCNADGCLVYLGKDRLEGLTSYDGHHLTTYASEYLAEKHLVDFVVGRRVPAAK